MKIIAQAKYQWRRFRDYLRYDFKEIVLPSSLPDPPGTIPDPKLTWSELMHVLKLSARLYVKSFKNPDIDIEEEIELMKNPEKAKAKKKEEEKKAEDREPSTIEDLAMAARAGSEYIRPALHRIYMTKASAYKDAIKNFVEGYQEGLKEILDAEKVRESRPDDTAYATNMDASDLNVTRMKPDDKASERKSADHATEMTIENAKTELKSNSKMSEEKENVKGGQT
ncbi:hypothetical protein KP509_20G007000 [Ceratopteris richardii]|uniref:Uncharacterized protein n=1 Tax=Ceratopteris richardii TaxID=49495 RepID=A0A8T2SG13_CERRI|nr:hypothetical protein KP509_20G007000 [Ceratopteris richardii]